MSRRSPPFSALFTFFRSALPPAAFLLALPALTTRASDLRFDRLSIDDGLSQSVVTCIAQDHEGFLWIGTQDGLNRYDGYSFAVYRHDPDRPASLSSSHIRALLEDGEGDLWVGTASGLDRLHHRTGEIERSFSEPGDGGGLAHATVLALAEGREVVWVGTDDGLSAFDRRTGRFRVEGRAAGLSPGQVTALREASDGGLWIGTRGHGLYRRGPGGEIAHYRFDPGDPASLAGDAVWAVVEDDRGRIWIGTAGGLSVFEAGRGFKTYATDSPVINTLLHDRAGRIWIGTEGAGLGLLEEGDLSTGAAVRNFRHEPEVSSSLGNDFVTSLFEDTAGNIWIGTWAGGLSKVSPYKHKFDRYSSRRDDSHHLGTGEVYAIAEESPSAVWIGTSDGLERFDTGSETFRRWRYDPADPTGLSNGWVYAILVDRGGDLWIGTYEGGLDLYRPDTGTFRVFRHDPDDSATLSHDIVNSLAEDPDGDLWVGTAAGLNRFDRAAERFARFFHDPGDPTSLGHDGVLATVLDRRHDLWVGTDGGGLDRLERASGMFHHPTEGVDSAAVVLSILEDRSGGIWFGTDGGGLHRLDPESGEILRLSERDGLPNNVVYGLVEDDAGFLWLSTNRGLSRLDPRDRTFRRYDVQDGLQSNEFNQGAFHRGASGAVYFGGIHGFNRFRPSEVRDNPFVPPVVITGFRIHNRPVAGALPAAFSGLTLSPRDSVFSFEYASLDFTLPSRNRYAYKMEGFDDDWIDAGDRRFATYTNLDPGTYTFRVRGSNSDGVWNTEGTAVTLTLEPAVWQTAWFRVLAAGLAVLLFAAAFRARVRVIERQKRRLEAEVAARTAELRAQAAQLELLNEKKNEFLGIATHEMRQPLNILLGYIDYVVKGLEKGQIAHETAMKCLLRSRKAVIDMNTMVSSLLDISAIESGKIDLDIEPTDLMEVLEECTELHLQRAEEKEISLALDRSAVPVITVDRSRIIEVIDNLVSNAIKYTYPGGAVRVSCELADGEVVTHVRDTGQGLSDEDLKVVFTEFRTLSARPTGGESSTGLGLAIVKKIVGLHGGRIWVESRQGSGARFSFALPAPAASSG